VFNFFRPFQAQEVLVEKPQHIAIIMDGNGRWAKKRFMPRISGHKKGLESVKTVITQCQKLDIPFLTLFAFSTENWLRPTQEVNFLISLFQDSIKKESSSLIRIQIQNSHQLKKLKVFKTKNKEEKRGNKKKKKNKYVKRRRKKYRKIRNNI